MLGWIISQLVIHCASHKISSLHEIQKPYYRRLRSTFLILNFNYLFFIHLNGIKAHQYLHMITFQTCKQVVLETRRKVLRISTIRSVLLNFKFPKIRLDSYYANKQRTVMWEENWNSSDKLYIFSSSWQCCHNDLSQ